MLLLLPAGVSSESQTLCAVSAVPFSVSTPQEWGISTKSSWHLCRIRKAKSQMGVLVENSEPNGSSWRFLGGWTRKKRTRPMKIMPSAWREGNRNLTTWPEVAWIWRRSALPPCQTTGRLFRFVAKKFAALKGKFCNHNWWNFVLAFLLGSSETTEQHSAEWANWIEVGLNVRKSVFFVHGERDVVQSYFSFCIQDMSQLLTYYVMAFDILKIFCFLLLAWRPLWDKACFSAKWELHLPMICFK